MHNSCTDDKPLLHNSCTDDEPLFNEGVQLAEGWLLEGVWSTEVTVPKGYRPGDEGTTVSLAQSGCGCSGKGAGGHGEGGGQDATPGKPLFASFPGGFEAAERSVGVTEKTSLWLVISLVQVSCSGTTQEVCSQEASTLMPFKATGGACSSLLMPVSRSQGL